MLPELPTPVQVGFQLFLIAFAALAAYLVVRFVVGLMVRHLLEARTGEAADSGVLPEFEKRVNTIARLVTRIIGAVIVVIAVLMVLNLFGINIGPAIAGLGVVGIAVGLGAQTLIRDWLSGIFIVLENQFSQGDVVRLAGVEGVVEDFSLRRTTLRDLDGSLHTVPNGQILVATNLTRLWAHVALDVTAAGAGRDRVTRLIQQVGTDLRADADWEKRLLEPPRVWRIDALPDSALRLKVSAQVRAAEQELVAEELARRITAALKRGRITIPVPVRVVGLRGSSSAPVEEAAASPESESA